MVADEVFHDVSSIVSEGGIEIYDSKRQIEPNAQPIIEVITGSQIDIQKEEIEFMFRCLKAGIAAIGAGFFLACFHGMLKVDGTHRTRYV